MRRFALIAVVWLGGCRVDEAPAEPIADHVALCCTSSEGPLSFRGCRVARSCRSSESIFVRGPVACGQVEAQGCEGGRCCSIALPSTREGALVGTPVDATPAPTPAPIVPQPFE